MGAEGLKLISEQKLGKNQYIHTPQRIQDIFRTVQIGSDNAADGVSENNDGDIAIYYHWCYDNNADLVLVTPYQLRDFRSEWHARTTWDPEGQRVRVPKEATDALNVSIGDNLYFVARDDVESLPVPTFYVFNAEKAESVMLQQDDEVLKILDRQENFS